MFSLDHFGPPVLIVCSSAHSSNSTTRLPTLPLLRPTHILSAPKPSTLRNDDHDQAPAEASVAAIPVVALILLEDEALRNKEAAAKAAALAEKVLPVAISRVSEEISLPVQLVAEVNPKLLKHSTVCPSI